eukprot:COSAG05_NODE_2297_length_3261_cov_16.226123_3_plen_100_part_00
MNIFVSTAVIDQSALLRSGRRWRVDLLIWSLVARAVLDARSTLSVRLWKMQANASTSARHGSSAIVWQYLDRTNRFVVGLWTTSIGRCMVRGSMFLSFS